MKKIILLLLIASLAGGYYFFYKSTSSDASKNTNLQKVYAIKAEQKKRIVSVHTVGVVRASERVILSSNTTDYVKEIFFKDGELVQKGDKLVTLISDVLESELQEAKARKQEAQQQFERFKNLLKNQYSAKSQYDKQEAELLSANAKLLRIEALINARTIKAPFTGILGFKKVSVGALLKPGNPIVALDMVRPIYIEFYLSEKYLYQIKQGQPFFAQSAALPDKIFTAKIDLIENRVDEGIGSILVRGVYDNEDLLLKPGMSLNVKVPVSNSIVTPIPEEALLIDGSKRYIFVLYPNSNQAKQVFIKIIRRIGQEVDISDQFPPGTQIITQGGHKISDGEKVEVIYGK